MLKGPTRVTKTVGTELSLEAYRQLQVLARHYRTNGSLSHALRLLIEDAYIGLKSMSEGKFMSELARIGANTPPEGEEGQLEEVENG